MLKYHETPEQASEYLRLALAFLGMHGIAPNPVNFTLAYEYILGRDQALKQAMDEVLTEVIAGQFDYVAFAKKKAAEQQEQARLVQLYKSRQGSS